MSLDQCCEVRHRPCKLPSVVKPHKLKWHKWHGNAIAKATAIINAMAINAIAIVNGIAIDNAIVIINAITIANKWSHVHTERPAAR